MIQKHVEEIEKSDIEGLITNGVIESKTLDYKREIPGRKYDDKKEFLGDVSSFANASGGDIIFGVSEKVNEEGKNTGIPDDVFPIPTSDVDEIKQWMEAVIRTGIDPRLNVQIKPVVGWENNKCVLVLRVRKSLASPHMVTLQDTSRFYSRNSAGKHQLDVHEIRSAFLATDSHAERIKRFIEDRLGKIVAGETPVPIFSSGQIVLHVIPMQSFLDRERLSLPDIDELLKWFPTIGSLPDIHRYNIDGRLICSFKENQTGKCRSYCQLFWSGALESVFSGIVRQYKDADGTFTAYSEDGMHEFQKNGSTRAYILPRYEIDVVNAMQTYLASYAKLELNPPISIFMTLLACKEASMYIRDPCWEDQCHPINQHVAMLPDVTMESLEVDVPKEMKPIFDAMWNACGYPGSKNYDKDGNWSPLK